MAESTPRPQSYRLLTAQISWWPAPRFSARTITQRRSAICATGNPRAVICGRKNACYPEPRRRRGTSPTRLKRALAPNLSTANSASVPTHFLLASPTLDLLLTRDGVANIVVLFVVDEAVQFVLFCKTLNSSVLVLPNATLEIIRHARVQDDSTAIGYQLNEERLHFDCEVPRRLRGSG